VYKWRKSFSLGGEIIKEKIIITGHVIEIYRYEKLNTEAQKDMSEVSEGEGLYVVENYLKTQRNRRNAIRRMATRNFTNDDKFLTLTFNSKCEFDIKDPKVTNVAYKKFIKRLRYIYPDIQYLAVIEFQDKYKRGTVHYHALISGLPYVPKSQLQAIWGHGFVQINEITHVDNLGAYVIKYMNKNMFDVRLQGLNAYLYSRKMVKSTILRSWNKDDSKKMIDIVSDIKQSKKNAVYSSQYNSVNLGLVSYSQYNLNRKNED